MTARSPGQLLQLICFEMGGAEHGLDVAEAVFLPMRGNRDEDMARQKAILVAREVSDFGVEALGDALRRTHQAVSLSERTGRERMQADAAYAAEIEDLVRRVRRRIGG